MRQVRGQRGPQVRQTVHRLEVERGPEDQDRMTEADIAIPAQVRCDLLWTVPPAFSSFSVSIGQMAPGGHQPVHAASASARDPRTTTFTLTVRSISASSRPMAVHGSAQDCVGLGGLLGRGIQRFHRSAWRATRGSVFFGPAPPSRIGSRSWTGRGAQTASWRR